MSFKVAVERKEYVQRISRLRKGMEQASIDLAALFSATDVYYFSGTGVYAILVVPLERDPILLVRINLERAINEAWLPAENVRPSEGVKTLKQTIQGLGLRSRVLGVEKDVISAKMCERLTKLFPETRLEDISPLVLNIRMVKSPTEIETIKKAAAISRDGFQKCEEVLRAGITEVELQSEIQKVQRNAGAEEIMNVRNRLYSMGGFGIVTSGSNMDKISGWAITISGVGMSSACPFGASKRVIEKGDLVLVDKGTCFQGYHVDEARTYVIGKATDRQRELFDINQKINEAAVNTIKPGIAVSEVYAAAKKVAVESGCEQYFMGYGQYGMEYLGHGVGLEIDEPPMPSPHDHTILTPGMVLAIEPKLIVPGWGGVDTEDTVLVTAKGYEMLTHTPRELVEISP